MRSASGVLKLAGDQSRRCLQPGLSLSRHWSMLVTGTVRVGEFQLPALTPRLHHWVERVRDGRADAH
eukprot:6198784-Pleurochrysis_carterae.AAC.1